MMRVPFTDLRSPGDEKALADVGEIVRATQSYVGGSFVEAFEEAWAEYCGARYCVSCANGTDAIELAARSVFAPGELVTVPALTFIGSVEGLERAGCRVGVVDIDPVTLLGVDADVEVSLYADRLTEGLGLLCDSAQAHGAQQGTYLARTWSFYPTKNLGAWGDAGAVTTNDEGFAQAVRERANHGGRDGFNSRMDAIQAAVLLAKLPYLDEALAGRATAGARYSNMLDYAPWVTTLPGGHAWHLYVIRCRVPDREHLIHSLRAAGVDARVHYPQTVDRWGGRDLSGYCPNATEAAAEVVSLPLWPTITLEQQQYVVDVLNAILTELGATA